MIENSLNSKDNFFNNEESEIFVNLLSEEKLELRYCNHKTASFDCKNRILYMPVWKNVSGDLQHLLEFHETGHAVWTPSDYGTFASKNSTYASYLNIVEDARIEKLQKRKFPGSKRYFFFGYKELISREFFGKLDNKRIAGLCFADRINLFFKIGSVCPELSFVFSAKEQVFIDRIASLETWDAVVAATDNLYEFCKQNKNHIDEQQKNTETKDSKNKISDSDETETEVTSDQSEDNKELEKSLDEIICKNDLEEKEEEESTIGAGKGSEINEEADFPEVSENFTKEITKQLTTDTTNVSTYKNVCSKNMLEESITTYKEIHEYINKHPHSDKDKMYESYCNWIQSTEKTISNLINRFEQQKEADNIKHEQIHYTGVLDMNNIHDYKFTENLFLTQINRKNGKKHGIIALIDWSGSMGNKYQNILHQSLILASFCRKIGIPFEFYLFRDNDETGKYNFKKEANTLTTERNVNLVNILSSKMTNSEFNEAMKNVYSIMFYGVGEFGNKLGLTGTPLISAMYAVSTMIREYKIKNGIQIMNFMVLTDGGSSDSFSLYESLMFVTDPITKRRYKLNGRNRDVKLVLDIIRDRCNGCNCIAYDLSHSPNSHSIQSSYDEIIPKKHFRSLGQRPFHHPNQHW